MFPFLQTPIFWHNTSTPAWPWFGQIDHFGHLDQFDNDASAPWLDDSKPWTPALTCTKVIVEWIHKAHVSRTWLMCELPAWMQWTLRNAVPTCDLCDDQRSVLCPLTSVAHLASTGVSVAVCVVSCMTAVLRATSQYRWCVCHDLCPLLWPLCNICVSVPPCAIACVSAMFRN